MKKQPYYPDNTRYAKKAAFELGLEFEELDYGDGYLFRISKTNGDSFLAGAGSICSYPLNTASAYTISRDKSHTNSVLESRSLPTIPSKLFFLSENFKNLRNLGHEIEDAKAYLLKRGFPVFCKPNSGSRGNFAEIISSFSEFDSYILNVSKFYDSIVIQPQLIAEEYRVFCIDDQAIFSLRKNSFSLKGDGISSVGSLIDNFNQQIDGKGVSLINKPLTINLLQQTLKINESFIVPSGEIISIPGRRNLSSGGSFSDFVSFPDNALSKLALTATKAIGLRVSGVDIFDLSQNGDFSELKIIEINGNPSITALELLNKSNVIDDIWKIILSKWFN